MKSEYIKIGLTLNLKKDKVDLIRALFSEQFLTEKNIDRHSASPFSGQYKNGDDYIFGAYPIKTDVEVNYEPVKGFVFAPENERVMFEGELKPPTVLSSLAQCETDIFANVYSYISLIKEYPAENFNQPQIMVTVDE